MIISQVYTMYRYLKNIISTFLLWLFPSRRTEILLDNITLADITLLPPAQPIETPHTHALFSYKDPRVTALIWEIKYHANSRAIQFVAPLLADVIHEEYADLSVIDNWQNWILIPMPSFESNRQHTQKLCRELARLLPSEITYSPSILKKVDKTSKQHTLKDKRTRLSNLHNTQKVVGTLPPSPSVILVDDVTTTGATLKESRRALMDAGVKHIIAFTIAH